MSAARKREILEQLLSFARGFGAPSLLQLVAELARLEGLQVDDAGNITEEE